MKTGLFKKGKNNLFNDKTIKFKGFKSDEKFEVQRRDLWCEIIIKEIFCNQCEDNASIAFHIKDIPKLINALKKLTKRTK